MPLRWTIREENKKRKELHELYVKQNKAIGEIGKILKIAESTVFDRMIRLGIPSTPERKANFCNRNTNVVIPKDLSPQLAEFIGILLGDGHLSKYQVWITVADIDKDYLFYILGLAKKLFKAEPNYFHRSKYPVNDIFIGSAALVNYFQDMGLVFNKVQQQVDVPKWIWSNSDYKKAFLKGFFDTDGSVYKLRFDVQMAFCNRSLFLLNSTRRMLMDLDFHPSKISCYNIYLTRKIDLRRYALEVGFSNLKHYRRALKFGILN